MADAKRLFTTIALMAVCLVMMAGPAGRGVYRTLQLDNGQQMRAMLVGDEFGHFWLGDDGKAYLLVDGSYLVVDEAAITHKAQVRRDEANALRAKRMPHTRGFGDYPGYSGPHKALVILVNFADVAFQDANPNAIFQRVFNEENFNETPFVGSVADYFRDQSRGLFTLDFDIVGPVTLSRERAYYGQDSIGEHDIHIGDMVIEAGGLVKDTISDWHQYDWDGNGIVDQVYLIFAGHQQSETGIEELIWSHQYYLSALQAKAQCSGPFMVADGLWVNNYACSPELNYKNNIFGIGAICHEYSHCLGLADTYDRGTGKGQGMYSWDLMCHGLEFEYYYHPVGYTSFERCKLGWMEPIVLEDADTTIVGMKSLEQGGECYIIYNKGHRDEFYLLENRQLDKWDAVLYGSGLLITHVDYDQIIYEGHSINADYNHQRMTWVPADGLYQTEIDDGRSYYTLVGTSTDPFPQEGVTSFNRSYVANEDQALRAVRLFNPNIDGTNTIDWSIEDITQNVDGTISFRFVANYSGSESGIHSVATSARNDGKWYSLDGRQLKSSPTSKGVYIHNGMKYIKH